MGKFICLYGVNNLGKTTQVKILEKKLKGQNFKVYRLKYPVYDFKPTGKFIYDMLRNPEYKLNNPTAKQLIYVSNRFHFEKDLNDLLSRYDFVIAEDYTGTGIAWGVAEGVDLEYLEFVNSPLKKPDLEILIDGERFLKSIEKKHTHENNNSLINKCREIHLTLAKRNSWPTINANQSIEKVSDDIWKYIKDIIN